MRFVTDIEGYRLIKHPVTHGEGRLGYRHGSVLKYSNGSPHKFSSVFYETESSATHWERRRQAGVFDLLIF